MLKCLAILAVVFGLSPTVFPIPQQGVETPAQTANNSKNKSQDGKKLAPPTPVVQGEKQVAHANRNDGEPATQDKAQKVTVVSLPAVSVAKSYEGFWGKVYDWGPWGFSLLLVGVGFFQVLLLFRTWKTIARQAEIQEAGMAQWVDLQPDGLFTTADAATVGQAKVAIIHPRWKVFNKTPLPFTVTRIETKVARDSGWEVSDFLVNEVIPPAGVGGHNYFAFFVPVLLTEDESAEFLERGFELSISIDVFYLWASGKEAMQSFADFYFCKIGELQVNKPLGQGPHSQQIEEYDGPSTLVRENFRVLEDEKEPPTKPN